MKEFDYASAWRKVIEPEFGRLDSASLELYRQTCEKASSLHQERVTLDMPFPDGAFRAEFEAVPSPDLSRSAAVIYRFGHWSPSGHSYSGSGGTWKFSNYADQILSARLGLPRGLPQGNGVFFRVHEGILRVALQTPWFWTWEEFGPATKEVLDAAQAVSRPPQPATKRNWRDSWEAFDADSEAYFQRIHEAVSSLLPDWFKPVIDTEIFMVEAAS